MKVLIKILTFLMMVTNVFSQTGENRVALVIGNKNYSYSGTLTYPIQDATTMKKVLEDLNFEVIYLTNGTKTQMTHSFLEFIRKVDNASISLIYYSGHGMQIDGVNHLIPVNVNISDKHSAKELTININNWVSQLEVNEQNLNIVILDACRNNPFKAFTKGYEKGLKQIPAPSGTIISFATLPDNVAQDNGLFAMTLAFEMRKDQRVIDVFMNTRNSIETKTKKQQSPMEWVRYNRAVNLLDGIDLPDDDNVLANNINNNYTDPKEVKTELSISKIDAVKVRDEIHNSPPYSIHQIIEKYKGLRVTWKVTYEAAHSPKDNKLNVMSLYKGNYPWVYFNVDLDEYPIFKVAKKGAKFLVTGVIIELTRGTFTLKPEEITEIF